jgi:hypothetical protein
MLSPIIKCSALAAILILAASIFEALPVHEQMLAQIDGLLFGKMKKSFARVQTAPAGAATPIQPVMTDHEGGMFDHPVDVRLQAPDRRLIHYTMDGSEPGRWSPVYSAPIHIDATTVLKYRRLAPAGVTEPSVARTYVVSPDQKLPVLSLTMDPVFLNNRHAGIYVYAEERGRKWRRPAQVEYFEGKTAAPLRFPAELRIHGHWTRELPKKSFQISYAPELLDASDAARILRPAQPPAAKNAVILRAAGVDATYRLGDELFRSLYAEAGGILTRASRAMLLINGQAWGLYNVHEKIDEDFLRRRFGPGNYEIIKYERAVQPVAGTDRGWNELLDFFARGDFRSDDALRQAEGRIDVANFTDWWLFNIYAAHLDWPHNNAYAFRKIAPGERWRWIAWDSDATFESERGLNHDTLTWATRARLRPDLSYGGTKGDSEEFFSSTVILRSLLENASYQKRFARRFCELVRGALAPERVARRFETILAEITPRLETDWERWPDSRHNYDKSVASMRYFIAHRAPIVMKQFEERFGPLACSPMNNSQVLGTTKNTKVTKAS